MRSLIRRPGAGDEDVDESFRALLPVGAGGDVRDANKGSKQIHGVKVLAYVAALDRTLDQSTNCLV